jgi:hypothetical protein
MLCKHDIGMRSGDGGVEDRAQERASVGHRFTKSQMETYERLSIQFTQKKTPADARGWIVPRMLRTTPLFAAWCAADPGS